MGPQGPAGPSAARVSKVDSVPWGSAGEVSLASFSISEPGNYVFFGKTVGDNNTPHALFAGCRLVLAAVPGEQALTVLDDTGFGVSFGPNGPMDRSTIALAGGVNVKATNAATNVSMRCGSQANSGSWSRSSLVAVKVGSLKAW